MPPRSTKKPPASAARATRAGRGVAAKRSPAKPTPARQYRQIDGVRYDDKCLSVADDAVKARGKISLSDARKVFESVLDGPGITRTEYDTLAFVANGGADGAQYRVVASAKAFLLGKMVDENLGGEDVEDVATTVKKKKRKRVSRDANEIPSPSKTTAATATKNKKAREDIVRPPETTATPITTTTKTSRRRENAANDTNDTSTRKRRRTSGATNDSRGADIEMVSDDVVSSDDGLTTVVKKRVGKKRRATAERTPADGRGNDAGKSGKKNRAVRFAETEKKTADDAETGSEDEIAAEPQPPLGSPLFSASPPPASPNTWLRRRSLSEEPSPAHTAGTRETTAPELSLPLARTPSDSHARVEEEARHKSVTPALNANMSIFAGKKAALSAVLERPVSARVAAAVTAGAFAASAVFRVAASFFFGDEKGGLDENEWRALLSRWADVESASLRLADALAAKRMRA